LIIRHAHAGGEAGPVCGLAPVRFRDTLPKIDCPLRPS